MRAPMIKIKFMVPMLKPESNKIWSLIQSQGRDSHCEHAHLKFQHGYQYNWIICWMNPTRSFSLPSALRTGDWHRTSSSGRRGGAPWSSVWRTAGLSRSPRGTGADRHSVLPECTQWTRCPQLYHRQTYKAETCPKLLQHPQQLYHTNNNIYTAFCSFPLIYAVNKNYHYASKNHPW